MDYKELYNAYLSAISICDPIEYANRQKNLIYAVSKYLLEKDKPIEEIEKEIDLT